jgi:4-hydroxy-2-oxoheptanedioate aldolase
LPHAPGRGLWQGGGIEKKEAVDHLEEILTVQGVDMVTFGYCDYAMSIGLPGQPRHPKVKEAERKTIETALKMGVPPRMETNNLEEARYYIDLGVRHLCVGWDLVILREWWKENGEVLRKLVS